MRTVKRYGVFVICILFLTLFYLRNINSLKMPAILMDEIGYWASAAFWNGHDWSSVMSSFSSYYSFGYSIILCLLMKIFKSVEVLHQVAIVVNLFMVLLCYIISNILIKKIFPSIKHYVRNVGCILPFFYPSIQYHTQVAWSETYLLFLFMCSILLAIRIYESGKAINYLLFAIVLVDMYITHQRSLGIMLVGASYILALSFVKKGRKKQFVVFALVFFACILLSLFVKDSVYTNVYAKKEIVQENEKKVDANDYSGQIEKIKYMFSSEGSKNLIISIGGKLYYFILASFFLGGDGLFFLIKKFCQNYKKRNIEAFVFGYIFLAYFSTLIIASIFMIVPRRIDTVAYGRYTDWVGIIIILLGVFQILTQDNNGKLKLFFIHMLFILLFSDVFQKYLLENNLSGFYSSCSPIMTFFNQLDAQNLIVIMTIGMVLGAIVLRLFLCVTIKGKMYVVPAMLMIFFWTRITEPAIDELIYIQYPDQIYPITNFVKSNDEAVYYLYDDTSKRTANSYTGSLQYVLQNRSIQCITHLPDDVSENANIIVSSNYFVPIGYVVECETLIYKVIRKE